MICFNQPVSQCETRRITMQTELPLKTFEELLISRDEGLYRKWLHNRIAVPYGASPVNLTAAEKDVLWCVGQQARRIAHCKEQ